MEPMSTGDLVRTLLSEGYDVTRKRIDGLIATGRVTAPRMVGPVRVWMPEDVEAARRVLTALDGRPDASETRGA